MKKQIKIGNYDYEIDYTQENAFKILDAVLEWMQHESHWAAHSGEGIGQDDNCTIDAVDLVIDIVDDILQPLCTNPDDDF